MNEMQGNLSREISYFLFKDRNHEKPRDIKNKTGF